MERTQVNIRLIERSFTPYQKNIFAQAGTKLEEIINSRQFKKWCMGYTFNPSWSQGKTNAEIFQDIIHGSESLTPGIDYVWNIQYVGYWSSWFRRRVIGYTYPNTIQIWFNKRHFSGNQARDIALVAGNIAHEYMHKLGYDHSFRSNPTRPFTVPYAVGNYVSMKLMGG